MNVLSGIFVLSILSIYTNASAKEDTIRVKLSKSDEAPLALIRQFEDGISKYILAIPEHQQSSSEFVYYNIDVDKKQNFFVACPKTENGNILYPEEYFKEGNSNSESMTCEHEMIPSVIERDPNKFSYNNIGLYAIGYWVWNKDNKKTDFVKIYQVRRTDKRTYYTIHTIGSLNRSDLDTETEMRKNQYQLVPYSDMPMYTWRITTTLFGFNMLSLPKSAINYLQRVDNYIRSATIDMNTPLRIYSGRVTVGEHECTIVYKLLLHPDENVGVVFVTLIANSKKCSFTCYDVGVKDGWSLTQEDKKKFSFQNLLTVFHTDYPKFSTYICTAEKGLLSAIGLDQFSSMDTLIGPRPLPKITKPPKKFNLFTAKDSSSEPNYGKESSSIFHKNKLPLYLVLASDTESGGGGGNHWWDFGSSGGSGGGGGGDWGGGGGCAGD